jgi:hypothetical protein
MTQAPDAIVAFSNLIDRLVRIAREEGLSGVEIHRRLSSHALLMAADLHCESGGNDESFIQMARHSLALIRTGSMEQ